jgi:hypothetical protein
MLMIQYGQSSTQANRHDITTASSLPVFPPSGVPMHGNAGFESRADAADAYAVQEAVSKLTMRSQASDRHPGCSR